MINLKEDAQVHISFVIASTYLCLEGNWVGLIPAFLIYLLLLWFGYDARKYLRGE